MNKINALPPVYLYVAQLIRMYPFTKVAVSYASNWPEECKRNGSDLFIIEIAKEAANDEKGHDKLILKDLETLKIPIHIALNKFRSDFVKNCISHFEQSVAVNHLHFLAWLFYSEKRTVDVVTAEVLRSFQKMLGPYHKAMRFWRIHNAVGPEREHVKKREQWIEALPRYQKQIVMQELDKVTHIFSGHHFDLDCDEFDHFISQHAPHLIDLARDVHF